MKKKILKDDWLSHPSIHYLSTVFQRSGYEILFVGGCIRNTILKKKVNDVDIATAATPEEIIKICKKNNIKAIPTGIKHGTITIIIDENTYQITTLGSKVQTRGSIYESFACVGMVLGAK